MTNLRTRKLASSSPCLTTIVIDGESALCTRRATVVQRWTMPDDTRAMGTYCEAHRLRSRRDPNWQHTCDVCATPIAQERVLAAESRGRKALYCSTRCRRTAARRRERASA